MWWSAACYSPKRQRRNGSVTCVFYQIFVRRETLTSAKAHPGDTETRRGHADLCLVAHYSTECGPPVRMPCAADPACGLGIRTPCYPSIPVKNSVPPPCPLRVSL